MRFPIVQPAAPVLAAAPPSGPNWLHEIKWDGWRCQIIKDEGGFRIYSRNRLDWTTRLPCVVDAARKLRARSFLIDGELIATNTSGFDFYSIPTAIKRMEVHVVAFDLLFRNDVDLRPLPLIERKAALAKLIKGTGTIQLSLVHDDGEELFKMAQEHGMEGIVSKRRNMPYRSGRCNHWLKVKSPAWMEANKERYKMFERKGRDVLI